MATLSSCGLADERRLLGEEPLPLRPEPLPLLAPGPLCEFRLRVPEGVLRVAPLVEDDLGDLVDDDLGDEEVLLLDLVLFDFERRDFAACFAIDHLSSLPSLCLPYPTLATQKRRGSKPWV